MIPKCENVRSRGRSQSGCRPRLFVFKGRVWEMFGQSRGLTSQGTCIYYFKCIFTLFGHIVWTQEKKTRWFEGKTRAELSSFL